MKGSALFLSLTLSIIICCQVADVKGEAPWRSFLSRFRPGRLEYSYRSSNKGSTQRFGPPDLSLGGSRRRDVFFPPPSSSSSTTSSSEHGGESTSVDLRDYLPDNRPPWQVLWESLSPNLQDPRQWGRWLASGAQIGLVLYLAHAVWKAASEVLDEYYASEQSGMDPSIFSRDHVSFAIEQLQRVLNDPSTAATALSWRADDRSNAAIAIAQRLVRAGVPLRGVDRPSVESILMSLSRNEANLLQECLWLPPRNESPPHLWERIIGLERVKRGLLSALTTIQRRTSHAYASLFDNSSAGVLLYGPPGCGKTMIAMAMSAMARIPCLLITPSVLLRKYVGETNQQCRTLFSLANKLSPCIICIDELDGLFRKRNEHEHEVSRDLKTEFLQHWEGMMSHGSGRNLVIAATNRPFDVDEAVLRRFTQSHLVGLPDMTSRTRLLRHLLREIPTAGDVDASQLAVQTEAYSPSDIRRLLQTAAAMGPLRESLAQPRPLTLGDIQNAIQVVPSTPLSPEYRQALAQFIRFNQPTPSAALPDQYGHDEEHFRWETEWGNFYHLGSLQVDAPTFELLSSIMERLNDMAEEFSDMEEEDETNNYHDEDKDN